MRVYIRNHSKWTRDKIVHVICKRLGNRVNRTLLYGFTKIHIGKTVTYFSAIEMRDKFGLWLDKDPIAPWDFRKSRRSN